MLGPELRLGPVRDAGFVVASAHLPHVAWLADAGVYVVTWDEQLTGAPAEIRAARLDASGRLIDELAIETSPGGRDYAFPAPLGSGFVVAWQEYPASGIQLRLRRFDAAAAPLGARIAVGRPGGEDYSPALATLADGTAALVYMTDRNAGSGYDVYLDRIDPAGVMLDDGGIRLSSLAVDENYPNVSTDGTQWFAGWRRDPQSSADGVITRITRDGVVKEPDGVPLVPRSGFQNSPRVSCAGPHCLVVWGDSGNGTSDDIFGTLLYPQSLVADAGTNLTAAAGSQAAVVVTWLGDRYLVVWVDEATVPFSLKGRELGPGANVGSVQTYAEAGQAVHLASDGAGRALLVYERSDAQLGVRRVFTRLVGNPPSTPTDAGKPETDGGSTAPPPAPLRDLGVGCGCDGAPALAVLLLAALLALTRRSEGRR